MKRLSIRVEGRVQGVWYRASAKQEARDRGLTGYSKNEPDGSVIIEAQGPADVLDDYSDWCRQGPPMAGVSKLSIQEIPLIPDDSLFTIRH